MINSEGSTGLATRSCVCLLHLRLERRTLECVCEYVCVFQIHSERDEERKKKQTKGKKKIWSARYLIPRGAQKGNKQKPILEFEIR